MVYRLWKDDEKEMAIQAYKEGLTFAKIQARLDAAGYPRTIHAIRRTIEKANLPPRRVPQSKGITIELRKRIRQLAWQMPPADIAAILDVPLESVRSAIADKNDKHRRDYSEEEIMFIVKNIERMTPAQIAQRLHREVHAIEQMIYRLRRSARREESNTD